MQDQDLIGIGLVAYPGAQQAALLGLEDLFLMANRLNPSAPQFVPNRWGIAQSGQIAAENPGLAPQVLILPPCLGDLPDDVAASVFTRWLRREHGRGVILCSICAGAFLLARTGLLAGRCATTHWVFQQPFHAAFPDIRLDMDRLIVDEGDVITAAGVMAWLDLGLTLVGRFQGHAAMIAVARMLVVDPPGREQRYYSAFSPDLSHGDAAILKAQTWLAETSAKQATLTTLARISGLEERTFLRRFQRATGMTSSEYCQRLRVGRAQALLQSGAMPVEQIAWEVGYSDPAAFRKVFGRIVGLTPGDYRQRFRGRGALAGS